MIVCDSLGMLYQWCVTVHRRDTVQFSEVTANRVGDIKGSLVKTIFRKW